MRIMVLMIDKKAELNVVNMEFFKGNQKAYDKCLAKHEKQILEIVS